MYGVEQPLFKLFSEGGKPREEAQVPRQPGAVSEAQGSLEAMPLLAFPPLGVSLSFSNWSMGRHALPLENWKTEGRWFTTMQTPISSEPPNAETRPQRPQATLALALSTVRLRKKVDGRRPRLRAEAPPHLDPILRTDR